MCRLLHLPMLVLLVLSAHLAGVAAKSEDEQYPWDDDDAIYSASSINLDGPDWNERNLVPIQCIRMNGAEIMVFTLFDNDRKEYDVAPTYDDYAYDDDYANANNNANANGCGGDDDAAVACDDAYYSNYNNGDDDENGNDTYNDNTKNSHATAMATATRQQE